VSDTVYPGGTKVTLVFPCVMLQSKVPPLVGIPVAVRVVWTSPRGKPPGGAV